MNLNKIYYEDCLIGMKKIPDKSVDMILCDLPYGVTACKWDCIIPFEPLFKEYDRIIKDNGVIALFGIEPFSTKLRVANLKNYRYDWIWEKTKSTGFLNAKKMPLRAHEIISIFYKKLPTYNPQMLTGYKPYKSRSVDRNSNCYGKIKKGCISESKNGERYPRTVIKFKNPNTNSLHPTQKPVELCEYLIKTYTNENEIVLDNCMGSGTTAIACINTNRQFIGFETNLDYYNIANNRIDKALKDKKS